MRIDHIGIAVPELKDVLPIYKALGMELENVAEVTEQGVRVALLPVGDTNVELLEPLGEESPIAKFLEKRGSGIHHIALLVEDIEEELKRLKEKGIRLIDEKPRLGAHGAKIAFLHPKSTAGVLIELCERG